MQQQDFIALSIFFSLMLLKYIHIKSVFNPKGMCSKLPSRIRVMHKRILLVKEYSANRTQ